MRKFPSRPSALGPVLWFVAPLLLAVCDDGETAGNHDGSAVNDGANQNATSDASTAPGSQCLVGSSDTSYVVLVRGSGFGSDEGAAIYVATQADLCLVTGATRIQRGSFSVRITGYSASNASPKIGVFIDRDASRSCTAGGDWVWGVVDSLSRTTLTWDLTPASTTQVPFASACSWF